MNKRKTALLINSLIVILECIGFVYALGNHGIQMLVFYTQLSNLVLLFASTAFVAVGALGKDSEEKIKKFLVKVKYLATCVVTVTFLVVIFVLFPMALPYGTGLDILIGEANLYHHMLCPILAIISFFFFEEGRLAFSDNLLATLPTLLYAIVTTTLNACKVIHGPYPFLYVYEQPFYMSVFWFVTIVGLGFLIALVLRKIRKKGERN